LIVWGHVTFKWQQGSAVVELDWPHSIPPIRCKDLGDISYRILLSQISLPWQQRSVGVNFVGSIRGPNLENPPIDAKISQISPSRS